jgi:DnaD/phage-associated family protein
MSKEYKIEGRPATIFRTVKNKDNPFVMIDRRPIDNHKLSFKAKGILAYLMSRPNGWEVSVTDLVKHGTDGEASIRSGLKELKDAGHMKYTTSRKEGRITGWLIEVYEVPSAEFAESSPDGDFQQVENLQVENQDVENRTQVLKTLSSNENNSTSAVFSYYQNNIAMLVPSSRDEIGELMTAYSEDWIIEAIDIAVKANKRNLRYIRGILKKWGESGKQDDRPGKPQPEPTYTDQPDPLEDQRMTAAEYKAWKGAKNATSRDK